MNATLLAPRAALRPEFAALLSVLFLMIDEAKSAVVHVTAPEPRAGTSTVAKEVAIAAATAGWCKVALVDASGPRHEGRPGLLEQVERGEPPSLEHERWGGIPVATGRFGGSAALPPMEGVRGLYAALRGPFNLVLVDCPPVLAGPHALVGGSAADGTVLVVEAGRSRGADAVRARELLEHSGAKPLGVVLNKARPVLPRWLGRLP